MRFMVRENEFKQLGTFLLKMWKYGKMEQEREYLNIHSTIDILCFYLEINIYLMKIY